MQLCHLCLSPQPPPHLWVVLPLWGCGPSSCEWTLMLSGHPVLEASSCQGRASLPLYKMKCRTFALQASLTARVPQPARVAKWQTTQNPRPCLSLGDGGSSLLWLHRKRDRSQGRPGRSGCQSQGKGQWWLLPESSASKHAQSPQRGSGIQTPLISALSVYISPKLPYCFELFQFYCIGRP